MKERDVLAVLFVLVFVSGWFSSLAFYTPFPTEKPELIKVRLAYQFGFHYGAFIIMDEFDLIEKYSNVSVEVTFDRISGGSTINEAILAGSIDFAAMGVAPAIIGTDKGVGTKILASMGSKEHEIYTWRDDIQSLADLTASDKINLVKVYSIEEVSMVKAFKDLGKSMEELEAMTVYFSHADAYQLMLQREIDAAYTGEPYNTMYREDTEFHKIGSDTEVWGSPIVGSAFIATERMYVDHPEVVSAVFTAWIEAVGWINTNQEAAARLIGVSYDYEAEEAWELWQKARMTWNPSFGLNGVKDFADLLYDLEMIEKKLSEDELMYPMTIGLAGQ